MIGLSYQTFVTGMVFIVLPRVVNPVKIKFYFNVINNSVTTSTSLPGLPSKSRMDCASVCEKENCCSVTFSEKDKLCFLTPSEKCFDGLTQASEEGWVTMMKISNKELFTMEKTWDDARAFCMSSGGRLAKVRNSYEHDAVVVMIKDQNLLNTPVWIGATDREQEGVFVWEGTSDEVIRESKFWNSGQPDDYEGGEDCLSYRDFTETGVFKLNDSPCQTTTAFICEFNSFFLSIFKYFLVVCTNQSHASNSSKLKKKISECFR